jgi:hypothetical protein
LDRRKKWKRRQHNQAETEDCSADAEKTEKAPKAFAHRVEELDPEDFLEFLVDATGTWTNGWMFYEDSDGKRIPLNHRLAMAAVEGVKGAEYEYQQWRLLADRLAPTLAVAARVDSQAVDYQDDHSRLDEEYAMRWEESQRKNDHACHGYKQQPWRPSPSPINSTQFQFNSQQSPLSQKPPLTPSSKSAQDRMMKYLMGMDGVPTLTQVDFERLGFQDARASYEAVSTLHYALMTNYEGSRYEGFIRGPKQDKLLQSTAFEKLESLESKNVLQWYKKLVAMLPSFNIALMPFNDVELVYGITGLCYPGVGLVRYNEMARGLALFLELKLPMGDDAPDTELSQALSLVASKPHPDGYEMVQTLLEHVIPAFKLDEMEMKWPEYHDYNNPYKYAEVMLQQVLLARKRGQTISDKVVAKTFLRNVNEHATKDSHSWAAILLKEQLDNVDADQPLPAKFELKALATYITTAKTQPSDVKHLTQRQQPSVYRTAATAPDPNVTTARSRLDEITEPVEQQLDRSLQLNEHIQGYALQKYLVNEVYRPNSLVKPQRKPMPNPSQARRYNRPRRAYDPNAYCDACGRWGHKATRCDMLAMAIWLMEFMKNGGLEKIMKEIQKYWMDRNAKEQNVRTGEREPTKTPLKILETYMDRYGFHMEQIANELDWRHFQTDYAEEPEPELPYEELIFANANRHTETVQEE